jgi:hypothetical protein
MYKAKVLVRKVIYTKEWCCGFTNRTLCRIISNYNKLNTNTTEIKKFR